MSISTEKSNPNTVNIDVSPTLRIVEMINNEDKTVAFAVEKELLNIAQAVDLIVDNFNKGGRLLYFGAGTSGRLGVLDASECPPTFGVLPEMVQGVIAGGKKALTTAIEGAEDDISFAIKDFETLNVKNNDTIVCISASGNPKYLLKIAELAKNIEAKTVVITSNKSAKLIELSDIAICPEVGAEPISGSSRMKSGTAQKMILNMLSTASMIKMGKTYKNFMVDLKATNEKLKNRAVSIVVDLTRCDKETALKHLKENEYDIKSAVIEIIFNVSHNEALIMLKQNDNILRKTLK
ncbi:N-acetylmuramic acid 6-phosphate etherase [bacterium]|nr:N-acetylmuramic acid 6-phosphate etherase [bacterium]